MIRGVVLDIRICRYEPNCYALGGDSYERASDKHPIRRSRQQMHEWLDEALDELEKEGK